MVCLSIPSLWGHFYQHGLTWIPPWICNYISSRVQDEITYPLTNFNRCTILFGSFIPHFTEGMWLLTHAGLKLIHVSKKRSWPLILFLQDYLGWCVAQQGLSWCMIIVHDHLSLKLKNSLKCFNDTYYNAMVFQYSIFFKQLSEKYFYYHTALIIDINMIPFKEITYHFFKTV